jgi:hypothetical protein
MRRLSEQLIDSLLLTPPNSDGLVVKLVKLDNQNYPGRDAQGILPILVTGHEAMSERNWRKWILNSATGCYGVAYAQKLANQGVDLKEFLPTTVIGQKLAEKRNAPRVQDQYLKYATSLISMSEKWPSLYNLLAKEFVEESMTLREMVNRIKLLPTPFDWGQGKVYSTLGDLIGDFGVITPDY